MRHKSRGEIRLSLKHFMDRSYALLLDNFKTDIGTYNVFISYLCRIDIF